MEEETAEALRRLKGAHFKLILATGETLEDVEHFPHRELFDGIVAENGGVLWSVASKREKALGPPPPEELLRELKRQGVEPLKTGRVVISTCKPHEKTLRETIIRLGLPYAVHTTAINSWRCRPISTRAPP